MNPNDLNYISPGHFLVGDTLNNLSCHNLKDVNINRLTRWQLMEQLRQDFCDGLLESFTTTPKMGNLKGTPVEGRIADILLIKQLGLTPLQWLLGRVEEIHPGNDGIARSATLRISKGKLIRPLSRLAILPIEEK